jgi:hypothetical protein
MERAVPIRGCTTKCDEMFLPQHLTHFVTKNSILHGASLIKINLASPHTQSTQIKRAMGWLVVAMLESKK